MRYCFIFLALVIFSCSRTQESKDQKFFIVSSFPIAFLVKKIVGSDISIGVLLPREKEPEEYDLNAENIIALQNANCFFYTGFPFEEKAASTREERCNVNLTTAPFMKPIFLDSKTESKQQRKVDPHSWLSLVNLKIQLKTILKKAIEVMPEKKGIFERRYKFLLIEINQLHILFRNLFEKVRREKKLIFQIHPSLSYFARDYGLELLYVEKEEGLGITPKRMMELTKKIQETRLSFLITSPIHRSKLEDVFFKEHNLVLVEFNEFDDNFLDSMHKFFVSLEEVFEQDTYNATSDRQI